MKVHACYIVSDDAKRSYIGYTVNPWRRLRQHNQIIKGGAKSTKKRMIPGKIKMIAIVYPFPNKKAALQFEWAWKHKRFQFTKNKQRRRPSKNKKGGLKHKLESVKYGLKNRLKRLKQLLGEEKWTRQSTVLSSNYFNLLINWSNKSFFSVFDSFVCLPAPPRMPLKHQFFDNVQMLVQRMFYPILSSSKQKNTKKKNAQEETKTL